MKLGFRSPHLHIFVNESVRSEFVPALLQLCASVPWPLNRNKAGGDLLMLQTLYLFLCKLCYSYAYKPVNIIIYM